jgi:integrase
MSIYPRADGIYVYDFRLKSVRFYGPTGTRSKREARDFERARREEAKQTITKILEQQDGPMTVNIAFDRFWIEVGDHYSGNYRQTVLGGLKWLTGQLGANTLIRNIDSNKIAELVARRRGDGVKNGTVNRTVTELMRNVIRRARRLWGQETKEIVWGDLILSEPKERIRELRDHEEDKLDASMRIDYLPSIRFALISGLRKKELVNLKWADIDFTARTITVLGKGDKFRTIPLTGGMIAILTPLRGHHPVFVFTYIAVATRKSNGRPYRIRGHRYPITYSGLSSSWRRFGPSKAGIEDFRFHDNRHTAGTRLLRDSGNLRLVQKLLGHEDITTTTKYAHADDDDLRAAMESVENSRKNYRIIGSEKTKSRDIS